jgi:mono/diheme cytochrome c family protein
MRLAGGMRKMKPVLILFVSMVMIWGGILAAQDQPAKQQQVADGQTLFEEVNCLMCHLLNGEGGGLEGAPDLAEVSTRRDEANLSEWLKTHLFEEPRIDMFEEAPTDENIEAIVQYLLTL